MAQACVFCGSRADSQEHIVPKWALELLADPRGFRATMFGTPGDYRQYERVLPETTVGGVCQRNCNGGWMSQLETDAQPVLTSMILGQVRTLSAEDQTLIARWAFKTALMVALRYKQSHIPRDHYHWFYERQIPPSGVWITLASYDGTRFVNWLFEGKHFAVNRDDQSRRVPMYLTTITIRHLVLQVWGSGDYDQTGDMPPRPTRPARPFVVRVWPIKHPMRRWPPFADMTDDLLLEFITGVIPGNPLAWLHDV
jgi:hypothetical protein